MDSDGKVTHELHNIEPDEFKTIENMVITTYYNINLFKMDKS